MESNMCEELSGWFYKARAIEQLRKEQQSVESLKKPSGSVPAAQPAEPETRVQERETIPV